MDKGFYQVRLVHPHALFVIRVRGNMVVEADPIGKWMVGKSFMYVGEWIAKKHGDLMKIRETDKENVHIRVGQSEYDALCFCEKACREFVRKVECGKARSRKSYKEMKEALAFLDSARRLEVE